MISQLNVQKFALNTDTGNVNTNTMIFVNNNNDDIMSMGTKTESNPGGGWRSSIDRMVTFNGDVKIEGNLTVQGNSVGTGAGTAGITTLNHPSLDLTCRNATISNDCLISQDCTIGTSGNSNTLHIYNNSNFNNTTVFNGPIFASSSLSLTSTPSVNDSGVLKIDVNGGINFEDVIVADKTAINFKKPIITNNQVTIGSSENTSQLKVHGLIKGEQDLIIRGESDFFNLVRVHDSLEVSDNLYVHGPTRFQNKTEFFGESTFKQNVNFEGNINLDGVVNSTVVNTEEIRVNDETILLGYFNKSDMVNDDSATSTGMSGVTDSFVDGVTSNTPQTNVSNVDIDIFNSSSTHGLAFYKPFTVDPNIGVTNPSGSLQASGLTNSMGITQDYQFSVEDLPWKTSANKNINYYKNGSVIYPQDTTHGVSGDAIIDKIVCPHIFYRELDTTENAFATNDGIGLGVTFTTLRPITQIGEYRYWNDSELSGTTFQALNIGVEAGKPSTSDENDIRTNLYAPLKKCTDDSDIDKYQKYLSTGYMTSNVPLSVPGIFLRHPSNNQENITHASTLYLGVKWDETDNKYKLVLKETTVNRAKGRTELGFNEPSTSLPAYDYGDFQEIALFDALNRGITN